MQNTARKGMRYFGNALKITLGAGTILGGTYLVSRIREKQDTESSLSRLEQMMENLAGTGEKEKAPGGRKK
jgi:hypothetical protein